MYNIWNNGSATIVLEGNIANEGKMAKWPLRNGVICVTADGITYT
jgi:hypothetical protein